MRRYAILWPGAPGTIIGPFDDKAAAETYKDKNCPKLTVVPVLSEAEFLSL